MGEIQKIVQGEKQFDQQLVQASGNQGSITTFENSN
jgi:hypothetical protein